MVGFRGGCAGGRGGGCVGGINPPQKIPNSPRDISILRSRFSENPGSGDLYATFGAQMHQNRVRNQAVMSKKKSPLYSYLRDSDASGFLYSES